MSEMKALCCWVGPMRGAKSTSALHAARRYQRLGSKVVLIRPPVSVRSHERQGLLITKNGETFPALECSNSDEFGKLANGADVVWIDEPFLFDNEKEVFSNIEKLRKNKTILVSTIGCDCFQKPIWESTGKILATADKIEFCTADCDFCLKFDVASRHINLFDLEHGKSAPGGDFATVCIACWNLLQKVPPLERSVKFIKK
jgi:thymidine kinase